jgi:hypothetical protein
MVSRFAHCPVFLKKSNLCTKNVFKMVKASTSTIKKKLWWRKGHKTYVQYQVKQLDLRYGYYIIIFVRV